MGTYQLYHIPADLMIPQPHIIPHHTPHTNTNYNYARGLGTVSLSCQLSVDTQHRPDDTDYTLAHS